MSVPTTFGPQSPRLGTYYAIFASAFAALVLLLLILEQLGARKVWLSHLMILTPLFAYLAIAIANRTLDARDFFATKRSVPHVFNGLALAATAIGGVGCFSIIGTIYLIGFDALALPLGLIAGFTLSAVMIVPYLRKVGAYSLPSYFRDRFGNPVFGLVAAILLVIPMMLLLVAELRIGAFVAQLFASVSFETSLWLGGLMIVLIAGAGGLRSLSWVQCAQYFVLLAGILTPLVFVSVSITNLPLPQFTFGELHERISSLELAIGVSPGTPGPLSLALPGEVPEAATKPFFEAFGALGPATFACLLICVLMGTAAMPSYLLRAGTAPSTFEARDSMGWATLFLGVFLVSAPAFAAFAKFLTLQDLVGTLPANLPAWIEGLREAALAEIGDRNGDGVVAADEILVSRDGATLALPIIAGLPFVLVVVVATGGIAAALAAATAHAMAIGTSLGEDIYHRFIQRSATPGRRLLAVRLATTMAVVVAAWFVAWRDFDALRMALFAFSLAGASFLPALILSIWWKRVTSFGALAGTITGFAVAALSILLGEMDIGISLLGIPSLLAAIPGVITGFAVAITVSLIQGAPPQAHGRLVDTMRDPSGEPLFDRLGHDLLASQKSRAAPTDAAEGADDDTDAREA